MYDLTCTSIKYAFRTNYSVVNPIQQNIRCYMNKTDKSLGGSQSNSDADYLVMHPVNMLSITGKSLASDQTVKVRNTCILQGKPNMIY